MKTASKLASIFVATLASLSAGHAFGAERITATFGPIMRSIDVQELRVLANTNRATGMTASILKIAKISPEKAGTALRSPFALDGIFIGDILYTPLGEKILSQLGQIIHPLRSGTKTAIPALRSAVMLSVLDDNSLSPIELISNYPVQLTINLEALLALSKKAKNLDDLARILHDMPGDI
ncbi:MAG: alpha/beta hydrolase [Burkholderiales bacterium]|nr:MAG: alpha/beta hydrolase [Burkholderiales bacterium]